MKDIMTGLRGLALALAVGLGLGCGGDSSGLAPGADDTARQDTSGDSGDGAGGECTSASATCHGALAVTCAPGDAPDVVDCAAAGLVCEAGSCVSSLESVTCVQFRPLRPVQTNTPLPASVVTAFAVDSCQEQDSELPTPIVGLRLDGTRADFEILEDGQPISVFESAARIFNDRRAEIYLSVVMDNSPSVAASGALEQSVAAAKGLVDQVMGPDATGIRIRVAFFSKAYTVVQDFTSDPELAKAALDGLLVDQTGSNTTNLYGALIDAVDESDAAQVARAAAMRDGVFTLGQVVFFTDGSDQAAVATLQQAQSAVQTSKDDVFLIALGGELNTDVLASLGKSGWALAETAEALEDAFAALALRVRLLQKRVYVLGYCSPKLAGHHTLTVRVKDKDGESAPVSFDASTFNVPGESCSAAAFEAACDGKDCGGLLCGGCAGEGLCTSELQCVCVDDHFALPDCTSCTEVFTGPACADCADPRFTGPECDQCAPAFTGPGCAECSDARFAPPDCLGCAPKFAGPECTGCADPRFTGPECDQCAPPWFGDGCEQCAPDCAGKACGEDGCGGECGECPEGLSCVVDPEVGAFCDCVPDCAGKECGDDGCGGDCLSDDPLPCLYCMEGQCHETCDVQCDGKDCGPDGCGGTCGVCPGVAPWCVDAQCALTQCPDGCEGQQCACEAGLTCVSGECSPCGAGCEGSQCGCSAGQVCSEGACCQPQCSGKQCGPDACGGSCGTCAGGLPCESDGQCCVPDCSGKECGDDGCGGECGTCPGVAPHCVYDTCSTEPCFPACDGQQCGDDGCGGSCACAAGTACYAGQCKVPCALVGGACPPGFTCNSALADGTSYSDFCVSTAGDEVWVPAGTFWMGCNEALDSLCNASEKPQHQVTMAAYAIDRTMVTAAAYKACVTSGACTLPSTTGGTGGTYEPVAKQDHPINYVTWTQASAYCAWSGKAAGAQRLCTEAEWERAARGGCETLSGDCQSQGRVYPWGNAAPTCAKANFKGCGGLTTAVGAKPSGTSPYGAVDMSGNVSEWVMDWYHSDYTGAPMDGSSWDSPGGSAAVARGGSSGHSADGVRASARGGAVPSSTSSIRGFRCCRFLP